MLAEKKTQTNIGIALGFILQIPGRLMMANGNSLGYLLLLIGAVLFIWGCMGYAEGKGHSKWLGLLGLLSLLGLIILVCLPDKHK